MYTDWLRTNGFTTETAPAPKRTNNSRKINPVLGKYAHPARTAQRWTNDNVVVIDPATIFMHSKTNG